jgi:hypothetical protein
MEQAGAKFKRLFRRTNYARSFRNFGVSFDQQSGMFSSTKSCISAAASEVFAAR